MEYCKLKHDYFSVDLGENVFIFNSFSGEPFMVSKADYELFTEGKGVFDEIEYSDMPKMKTLETVTQYTNSYFGPTGLDLSVSESCNLGCPMCFHGLALCNAEERRRVRAMPVETAKKWIDYYISYATEHNLEAFTFHIGSAEPFMFRNNLWEIIGYINEKVDGHKSDIFLNTNLTLVNDDDIQKIRQYGVRVSVGIDGLKTANDATRVYKGTTKGTFDDILLRVKKLISEGVDIGVNITLNNNNFELVDPKQTVQYFYSVGVKSLLIDTDIVTHISYDAETIVNKLMKFVTYGEELGMVIYGSWQIPFNMMTAQNSEEPKSFCAARTGKNIVVTPSKGITFCTYSGNIITDMHEDPKTAMAAYTSAIKKMMPHFLPGGVEACHGCPLEGMCMGGCMLAHENHGKENHMCDIYLLATAELIKHYYS